MVWLNQDRIGHATSVIVVLVVVTTLCLFFLIGNFAFSFSPFRSLPCPQQHTVHGRDSVFSSRAARRTHVKDVQSMNCVAVATDCEDVCSA